MTTTLPPNVELLRELLLQEGPSIPDDLRERLRTKGIYVAAERIASLPTRYPDVFSVDIGGRLAVVSAESDNGDEELVDDNRPWWTEDDGLEPILIDDVVVIDIETEGLARDSDRITEIAALHIGSGDWVKETFEDGEVRFLRALDRVEGLVARAAAVAGHCLGTFDLPFMAAAAQRNGRTWCLDPKVPVLDVHTLSLIVDPTLVGRSLGELCTWLDIDHVGPHTAEGDVRATAEVLRELKRRCDAAEPSYALARRCLAEGRHPLARFLPRADVPADLTAVLIPLADELVAPQAGDRPGSAVAAVAKGFARLQEEVGHTPRLGQRQMADEVASAFTRGERLMVEAPTGTGKSLAYLVPAAGHANAGNAVVVATHTKVLQRQLKEDATSLRKLGVLTAPFRQVMGVENYLCTREIADAFVGREAENTEWLALAVAIRAMATASNGVWDDVTDGLVLRRDLGYTRRRHSLRTSANSCERKSCEHFDRCPLFNRLQQVDRHPGVVAVNHALVAAWTASMDRGRKSPGDVLGEVPTALVFDEAHTLEDSLTSGWTEQTGALGLRMAIASVWGRRGPIRLARKVAGDAHGDLLAKIGSVRKEAEGHINELGVAVARYLHEYQGEREHAVLHPGVVRRRPEYQAVAAAGRRVAYAMDALVRFMGALAGELRRGDGDGDGSSDKSSKRAAFRLAAAASDLDELSKVVIQLAELGDPHLWLHLLSIEAVAEGEPPEDRWLFQRVPISVAARFAETVAPRAKSLVLTSATLSVNEPPDFNFVAERLGLKIASEAEAVSTGACRVVQVPSPFDYNLNSAVVLTAHLPVPTPVNEKAFCEDFAADQIGFLSLSGGRTMTLFAARKRMEIVAEMVRTRQDDLIERGVRLVVQGEDSPALLRAQFRNDPGTVLYGLRSYWEGFDAPGETLSYLFIEKPPYPHPDDPIAAARQGALSDVGRDPFLDYVVPRTAITMAQGFGRLLRTETDRGVALICDRRMQLPTVANHMLLAAIPTRTVHHALDGADAWTYALRFITGSDPDLAAALHVVIDPVGDAIENLRLLEGEDPLAKLEEAARQLFGIDHLRPEQLQLMLALLNGQDALGFLPTGFGKSLCFQLPALLHPEGLPTIVVSPLVALIKDQVDDLRARKGIRSVAGITGRTTTAERTETLRDLAEGKVRLLYVSPERLVRDANLRGALAQSRLGALVVDEAHCVSVWGHDFRPEFRQIAPAVTTFQRSSRLGLTATATPTVEKDIVATLELENPVVVRNAVDRPDLRYWVVHVPTERARAREALRFVVHQGTSPGVIYASRRSTTEELAWLLRQAGVTARAYHGDMVPEQREAVQDDFLAGTTQVIVATKAFGLGVNKADIGWVLHYDLPESLEAYAQEAGRAARAPELTGECALLFTSQDIARRKGLLRRKTVDEDVSFAEHLVDLIKASPTRGNHHLLDSETAAAKLAVEIDVLNIALAWLERAGTVRRHQDVTVRGHVTTGAREPQDKEERHLFVNLFRHQLRSRAGTRRMIDDFDRLAGSVGMDPDDLDSRMVDWTLRRLVTFQSTQRRWRVELVKREVDHSAFNSVIQEWRQLEDERLTKMVTYASSRRCRRSAIAAVFGDRSVSCVEGSLRCDSCDGGDPPWHQTPLGKVPDPEHLVDLDLVVLQAVRWANRSATARYGEVGLKAAICGKDSLGEGRPLRPGLLSCPQFGALRYLRGADRRVDQTVDRLISTGVLRRREVQSQGRNYWTLEPTDHGLALLGVVRA